MIYRWPVLFQIRTWFTLAKSVCLGFEFLPESLDSSSQRVALATNEQGIPVVFSPIEKVLLVRSYAVNPTASAQEIKHAGYLIDAAVAREAQSRGISNVLLVVPKDFTGLDSDSDFEEVRIYVRNVDLNNTVKGWGIKPEASTHAYIN